jgi:methyl-accepting chemotaxis protein
MTQQNAAVAEQSAAATETLAGQATQLQSAVANFKLD